MWNKSQSRSMRSRQRNRRPLSLERLEDRCLMNVDMVTNLSGDSTVTGSLPYEVAHAQAGDTITFQQGLQGTITPVGLGAALDINKNLNIVGPGANALAVSGGGQLSVFVISTTAAVSISGLTIRDGSYLEGGGILNWGNLTLNNVQVTDNQALVEGGGIYNVGSLNLTTSTVARNTVNAGTVLYGLGGGIYNAAGGTMMMVNDTVADNNIQVTGNALIVGGGIANAAASSQASAGNLTLVNVTVADNTLAGVSPIGRGIDNGGSLTLVNSIVSNSNPVGVGSETDVHGQINYASGDLFSTDVSTQIIAGQSGSNQFNANPLLGPLQIKGGPTPIMPLSPGSPALGAGVNSSPGLNLPTTDQRGIPRPANSPPDIGAYQHLLPPPPPPQLPPPPPPYLPPLPSPLPSSGSTGSHKGASAGGSNGGGSTGTHIGPSVPVGGLTWFAFGFGPGLQLDLFEVDEAGQLFAAPLLSFFGGAPNPTFLSGSLDMGNLASLNGNIVGNLLGGGQSYLMELANISNPYVVHSFQNAVQSELSGKPAPPPTSVPSTSPPPTSAPPTSPSPPTVHGFSGSLTGPLSILLSLTDEDDDFASLDGDGGTVTVIGDGKDGVNISGAINLNQSQPLTPKGSWDPVDYTKLDSFFTFSTHATTSDGLHYSGDTFYITSSGLTIMVPANQWSLEIDPDPAGPWFAMSATSLQLFNPAPGGFGIALFGTILGAGLLGE